MLPRRQQRVEKQVALVEPALAVTKLWRGGNQVEFLRLAAGGECLMAGRKPAVPRARGRGQAAALAGSLKDSSALLWTPEEVIEAVEGTPDWARQIAQQLLRLRSTYDATSPIGELTEKVAPGEDHCCKYEPSVVFWWSPDDDMGRIYDDVVNDRYEVGPERWQEELLALPLRSEESIVPMVDWMEAAFPFMRAVGDLHDMLWEAQKLCK